MPKTRVILYVDDDGRCPLLDWLENQPSVARAKCLLRIERLKECGHELRRPEADFLRDGIYELRASVQGVNYRLLYFFHGNVAAIVSHGITKEREVPPKEIGRAIERKLKYLASPRDHGYTEEEDE